MNFISYGNVKLANRADEKTPALQAEQVIYVYTANACNTSKVNIRVSLMVTNENDTGSGTFVAHEVLLKPNENLNLADIGKTKVTLLKGDNLLCFSDSYKHLFSCFICYVILNET